MNEKHGFHKILQSYIASNHLSQKEAAARLGVSRTTLQHWTNGGLPNGENLLNALTVMLSEISEVNSGVALRFPDEDWRVLTAKDKKEIREDIHRRACYNRSLNSGK